MRRIKRQTLNLKEKLLGFDIEDYGCSFVSAEYVKEKFYNKKTDKKGNLQWKVPNFSDLHPSPAKPFHHICELIGSLRSITNCINNLTDKINFVQIYSREELIADDNWLDLSPAPHIGRLPTDFFEFSQIIQEEIVKHEFRPKFRLILSKQRQQRATTIVMVS